MARTRKDRSAEVQAVFDGLQYCTATQLNEVIERAKKKLDAAKKAEIEEKRNQIKRLQGELKELEGSKEEKK